MFLTFIFFLIFIFSFISLFFNFNLHQLFLLNGLFNLGPEDWECLLIAILIVPFDIKLLFFFLISLVITSAFCMLSFKKLMNSLIHLIVIFMIMGLLLLLLNFDFLAVLTLLIYVGAIMVFFLFAILLLLKFFSFKVMTLSKNKLITHLDYFLIFYFFLAVLVFFYSMAFSLNGYYDPVYYLTSFGYVNEIEILSFYSKFKLTILDFGNLFFYLKLYSFFGYYYLKELVHPLNFSYKEFFQMNDLHGDTTLHYLANNIAELDLIHVYGFQLYIYYSFLLIAAAVLLSIVIFAALKISKPFKSVLVTKYSYK